MAVSSTFSFLRDIFLKSNSAGKLIFLLVFMAISLLILTFLGTLLAIPLFGIGFFEIQESLDGGFQNGNIHLLRYFLAVQNIAMFLVPAIMANYLVMNRDQAFLARRYRMNYILPSLLVIGILVTSIPLISWLIQFNERMVLPEFMKAIEQKMLSMEAERGDMTNRMMEMDSYAVLALNILLMAVVPAIGEEFFFRGAVQSIFKKWSGNEHVAILITAIIFSAIHMQFYGFLPRFFLGVLFGYIFFMTGSIWLTVLAHFVNNAMSVILVFMLSRQVDSVTELAGDDSQIPVSLVMLSILGVIGMMILLTRFIQRERRVIYSE